MSVRQTPVSCMSEKRSVWNGEFWQLNLLAQVPVLTLTSGHFLLKIAKVSETPASRIQV